MRALLVFLTLALSCFGFARADDPTKDEGHLLQEPPEGAKTELDWLPRATLRVQERWRNCVSELHNLAGRMESSPLPDDRRRAGLLREALCEFPDPMREDPLSLLCQLLGRRYTLRDLEATDRARYLTGQAQAQFSKATTALVRVERTVGRFAPVLQEQREAIQELENQIRGAGKWLDLLKQELIDLPPRVLEP
jgi:hypothetical protein